VIKRYFKIWLLCLAFIVAAWLDRVWPIADAPIYRAEPFSLGALFISLAFSAASYAINRIFGPKPPKVTRGQMSGELFIQNADEGSPVCEIYGAAPAQTIRRVTWANLTNAFVNSDGNLENNNSGSDNCGTNASGTGDSGAWSVQTIDSGDFEVTWTFRANDDGDSGRSFVGLTNGSFTLDFTQWDYAIHVSTALNTTETPNLIDAIFVYEGSPPRKAYTNGTWSEGDTLRITCQSGVVKYWHKSTLLYTSSVAPSYPLRVVASMACHDSTVEDVSIRTPAVDNKGGIKTAGTVIWCKEPRKVVTKEKKGGKGAPKQTVETITYYTDLAILFGRGRLRLKKLWANADLIVDLDAAVGSSTGIIDPNAGLGGSYDQDGLPLPGTGPNVDIVIWGHHLTPDQVAALGGQMGAGGGASMRWYQGNYDQLPDSLIEADVGAGNAPAYRGYAYLVIENFNISKYGGVPTFLATVENVDYDDLAEIANHLCERVGIEPGDRDFSVFDGQAVRGLIVQQPQAPRATLELAALPYAAEFFETVDGMLTGVYAGGSSVVTIDPDELGMLDGDSVSTQGEMGSLLEFSLIADDQLPRQMTVTAFDPYKDHETTTQSAYRMTGFSQGVEQVALPMALSPDETRQSAERVLYQRHTERESAAVRLPWKYAWVNPTDLVTVNLNGISHRLKLAQIAGAVPGLLEFQAVADQLEVYSQTIAGDSGSGHTPQTIAAPAPSVAILVDTVTMRDVDGDTPLYYAAAAPLNSTGAWKGAALYRDRGAGYELAETFLTPAIAGVLVNSVSPTNTTSFDESTTVTVDLYGTDTTLESVTEAEVLAGANAAILGDGMIFQFRTASQVGGFDNRWNLTGLLWGRRGSDFALGTFAAGSRFLLLDGAVIPITNDLSERGIARDFKAVTVGFALADAASTSFTWNARTLMPLSVVDVQGSRNGGNDLTITWKRRTRVGGAWIDYTDAPLSEAIERYEIDVMNGSTVVRTITVNDAQTASYTAADQTTDFGSPQSSLTVKIYQISAVVGRGFVRTATV
jgi:hypothetical protein